MADNKKDKRKLSKFTASMTNMNNVFSDLIKELDGAVAGNSLQRQKELQRLGSEINRLSNKELDSLNVDVSNNSFDNFLKHTYEKSGNPIMDNFSTEDLFKAENADVLKFFQERYKSKYYIYDDIDLVSNQISELKEAVKTLRDTIINADDISNTISSTIIFKGVDADASTPILEKIKNFDKELDLSKVIKNEIVYNTLKYGEFFTYLVSYADIIRRYDYINSTADTSHINAMENVLFDEYDLDSIETLTESAGLEVVKSAPVDKTIRIGNAHVSTDVSIKVPQSKGVNSRKNDKPSITQEELIESMNHLLQNYRVYNDDIPVPMVEGFSGVSELSKLLSTDNIDKITKKFYGKRTNNKNGTPVISDGVVDYSAIDSKKKKDNTFGITGVYIKHIDPRRIIPIKILDGITLGYYWIREEESLTKAVNHTTTFGLNSSFSLNLLNQDNTNKNLERELVGKLVEKIVKAFDKKYLEDNSEFKELIINALLFDETYKKNVYFQFISAEHIIYHSIENKESVLSNSLFNGKLYLGLLLFKMLAIISKSNDTRIYTIQNSIDEQDKSNNVQRIIREIKANQMSYLDLMNYNSLLSKIGANKSIFMPSGSSGTPPVTFDILAGQSIELHNDLMEMLKNASINATGVPSVLMNNFGQDVEYAKQIEIYNVKFASRCSGLQLDLSPSITQFYKKILLYTSDFDENIINSLEFTFNPPKASNIVNSAEQASNSENLINYMIEKKYEGNVAYDEETLNALKAKKTYELAKHYNPNLPWDLLDDEAEALLEIKKDRKNLELQNSSDTGSTGDDSGEEM